LTTMRKTLIEISEDQVAKFDRLIIVGDIHGDIDTLNKLIFKINPKRDGILFLGDYADRGESGIEVIATVSSMKSKNPQNIFLLKGNHEIYDENGNPHFYPCTLISEAEKKKGNWLDYYQTQLKPFIESLALAAIIPGCCLFVHGGISNKLVDIESLRNPTAEMERDVLWSDPFDGSGEKPNAKRGGAGVEFGFDVTLKVCRLLGVKKIVRSHEPKKASKGPYYMHHRKVITVSSTREYGGHQFVLALNPSNMLRFYPIRL
jgi:serine/threonine-protein phosphatase PP1 catalytic subunit